MKDPHEYRLQIVDAGVGYIPSESAMVKPKPPRANTMEPQDLDAPRRDRVRKRNVFDDAIPF